MICIDRHRSASIGENELAWDKYRWLGYSNQFLDCYSQVDEESIGA
jgi:hypothetical protein